MKKKNGTHSIKWWTWPFVLFAARASTLAAVRTINSRHCFWRSRSSVSASSTRCRSSTRASLPGASWLSKLRVRRRRAANLRSRSLNSCSLPLSEMPLSDNEPPSCVRLIGGESPNFANTPLPTSSVVESFSTVPFCNTNQSSIRLSFQRQKLVFVFACCSCWILSRGG